MDLTNWYLYFCVITVNVYFLATGFVLSWNSTIIPKLLSNDTSVNLLKEPITTLQVSTLTTIFPLGSIIGTILISKIPDIIGRKTTLQYLAMLAVLSIVSLLVVTDIYIFCLALTIFSITIAGATVVIPMYITEIAEDCNRGKLGSLMSISIAFGIFFSYLIGPAVSVKLFILIGGLPVLLVLYFSFFIPESPVFLVSTGDTTQARYVLKLLRRHLTADQIELESNERQRILRNTNDSQNSFINIFKSRPGSKAFFISLGVGMCQQLSGMYIVLSFLATLFNQTGSNISGETLAALLSAGKIVSSCISFSLIEKLGRRFLILFALCTCGTSMFVLGFYYYFKVNFNVPGTISIIPILCFFIFMVTFTFGLGCVPFIIISELLPNDFRAVGSSVVYVISNVCLIAISFTFPLALEYLGTHYCMFGLSFTNFVGFVFVYLMLPETKGRSFSEIRTLLNV